MSLSALSDKTTKGANMPIRLFLLAALVTVLVVSPGRADAALPEDWTLAAHRGYHPDGVTENTIHALALADRYGASAMETDLNLTKDDYMVVMHDPTLRRTTTCRGWIDRRTKRNIRQNCREDDGESIPFATDLLKAAADRGMNLMMEVKHDRLDRWTEAKFRTLARLVTADGMAGRVMLTSFEPNVLARAAAATDLRTMLILTTDPTGHTYTTTAVSIFPQYATTDTVAALHADGVAVWGHSTDDPADWRAYEDAGVDGLTTNDIPGWVAWHIGD